MEGAHALNKTPGSSHQENDLTPQLDEYINKLVDRRVGLTEERSEARIKAAETEILVLREELLKDRAKLDTLEARAAEKNRKRKERKARKKNTISEPEPIPEKRQRTDSTMATVDDGPSQEELTAEADLVREIEFHNPRSLSDGNMTTVRVAERISRERQLLRHSAKRMEGLTPSSRPAGDLINPDMWYNWRRSNKARRIPHMNLGWVIALLEFLGVDRATMRSMSAEAKDETYCVGLLMLYHCGLIHPPNFLHSSYHNPNHSMDGAIRRMRWAVPKMISYLGSNPATHITFKYNVLGLPNHLREYSKGVARLNPSPPGQRSIDSRLSPRKEATGKICQEQ